MIEDAGVPPGLRPLSRRLMVGGLGFWAASVGGAFVPGVLRTILYPNHAVAPRFELVGGDALGAPVLWSAFVCWCVSWAVVLGYVPAAWPALKARRQWAARALFLLSLGSPLVFAGVLSVLVRMATQGAWHADGALPFLPSVLVQLAILHAYSVLMRVRPRAGLQPLAESA